MNRYLAIGLLSCVPFIASAQTSTEKKPSKLVWSDEFDYTGLPDSTRWTYEKGFVRNKEPQYYTSRRLENCRVENGMLVIEARKENFPNAAYKPGSTEWPAKDSVAAYTSASLITLGKKTWKYGRIEVRAKVPKGIGIWPAIWMLGENRGPVKWPECGEIDIMEFVGRDSTRVYGTVHYADSTGKYGHQGEKPVMGAPYDEFHIYALNWYPDRMEFYYDDQKFFVFDLSKSQNSKDNPFQKKFYLLLNLALGRQGTLGGPLDDRSLPCKYFVDYVRVYQ
ncbi:MAG: glycoside hydrolase family 16 protein [Chitinophagaceae bacterium]